MNNSVAKVDFAALIPHCGTMSLIDQVESWTDNSIYCTTESHLLENNPLRFNNQLSAIHLIEYGAQAMAIHGGLLSGHCSPGYLAAIRAAHLHIDILDTVKTTLHIKAQAELNIANGAVYALTIFDNNNHLLLDARATVIHTEL